ncbi:hypothetical protein [Paenibacillus illinoisensis]|uniref:hypothetical protein n=1 Tax=Paenibacillus illinoisensis TaxID=59845 RepID=UPI001C8E76F9|nr:hypothetical protein [Paenibacillus illinoisensis]MBY0217825.1 hypothetical protein [Paenibacillus illinoisensis]
MTLSPSLRKLVLTLHVITTMGWLGSAAAYIPIGSYVLTNQDAEMIRSAIQIMSLIANFIVIPVAIISLLTGIALSLGTKWGLIRHYWIFIKLVLTAFAVFMLIAYALELSRAASIAEKEILSSTDIGILQDPLHIIHPSGGLIIVLVATVLSVYKPKGLTRYGWRKQLETKRNTDSTPYSAPRWTKNIGYIIAVLFLVIAVLMVLI